MEIMETLYLKKAERILCTNTNAPKITVWSTARNISNMNAIRDLSIKQILTITKYSGAEPKVFLCTFYHIGTNRERSCLDPIE